MCGRIAVHSVRHRFVITGQDEGMVAGFGLPLGHRRVGAARRSCRRACPAPGPHPVRDVMMSDLKNCTEYKCTPC